MYLCGACRVFTSDSFNVTYKHNAQCTDYYFDQPDYNYNQEN